MLSISSPTAFKSNLNKPDYGVLSMSGNIEFIDYDGSVEALANNLLLVEGLKAEIYLNNTLTGKSVKVGDWITGKWNYEPNDRTVTVTIHDGLENWQEIEVPRVNYDAKSGKSKSLWEFYDYLFEITQSNGYNMTHRSDLDTEAKSILQTVVVYPRLEAGNLWHCWQKLAEAAQSYVYMGQDGIIKFKYDGGA
jgi:hypothetical protein